MEFCTLPPDKMASTAPPTSTSSITSGGTAITEGDEPGEPPRTRLRWGSGLYSTLLSAIFIFDDPEERQKCGLLVVSVLILLCYNSAYVVPAFFVPSLCPALPQNFAITPTPPNYFSLLPSASSLLAWIVGLPDHTSPTSAATSHLSSYLSCITASNFLSSLFLFSLFEICLLSLLYATRNLYAVAFTLFVFVDCATVSMCLQFGLVTDYMVLLVFIPIFLFFLFGSGVGLAAMLFICAQALSLLFFTIHVAPPVEQLIFTPTDRLLSTLVSYLLVGCTAFVHANSRSFTLNKLRVVLQESEASNAQLQKATKAKAQFLANMSHELRTPLHGILAMAREMMEFQMEDAIRECGQIIAHCGDHMHSLINDILDFEKIESDQLRLEDKVFSVSDVVNHLVEVITPAARKKQVRLGVKMDVAHPIHRGDALRFRQIVLNLLSNAIKFTPASGEVTVAVSNSEDRPDLVRVDVQDTGIGIPEDHVSHLFEGFYLVDASITRRHGGSGLGLGICKRLTEAMGGSIGCSSTLGQGSHFWFTVTLPTVAHDADKSNAEVPTRSVDVVKGAKILLVEDNLINQKVGIRVLNALGCSVVLAEDGEECLRIIEDDEEGFDAVLMDCQMPVMDGFEATIRLRQKESQRATQQADECVPAGKAAKVRGEKGKEKKEGREREETDEKDESSEEGSNRSNTSEGEEDVGARREKRGRRAVCTVGKRTCRRVPVIALTASATSEYRQKCYDSGMDDWMSKPFKRASLHKILTKWIAASRAETRAVGDNHDKGT